MREYVWLRACLHDALPEVIREMIAAHALDVRGKGACQRYLLERQIVEEIQDLAEMWALGESCGSDPPADVEGVA